MWAIGAHQEAISTALQQNFGILSKKGDVIICWFHVTKSKNKRSSHGTNSNIARDKVALENQWLEYMKMKVEQNL